MKKHHDIPKRTISIVSTFLLTMSMGILAANAASTVSPAFNLDGRLYTDTAATNPLLDNSVTMVIQILDPTETCILYEETQTSLNTNTSNGYFSIEVGTQTGDTKRSANDSGHELADVYSNFGSALSGKLVSNGAACSYNRSGGAVRYVRVQVTPSSDSITRVLSPNMLLDSVPTALVAERAETLQGLAASQVLQVNTTAPAQASQSNIENIFSTTNYPILTALLAGTSSLYNKPAANGTNTLPSITTPSSPAAGQIWYDSGTIKFYNGTSEQSLGIAGAGVNSITAGTGLTGGTITNSGTIAVDVGTTSGKILQLDGSAKIPAVDGSQLTNLNGSAITSGTIGGSTAINTTGTINSGAITSTGSVSSSDVRTNAVRVYKPSTANYVELVADSSLAAPITLTLPTSVGGSGQVLQSNGSGVLSWVTPVSGTVTSVSGTAPIAVATGTTTPVISIATANTTTTGALSSTDWNTFNNKLGTATAFSGDVSGAYNSTSVDKIKGRSVSATAPTNGQVLTWNNGSSVWEPSTPTTGTITALTGDVTASGAGSVTATIATGAVTTGKILDGTIAPADLNFAGTMSVNTGLVVRDGSQFYNKTCSGNEVLYWSVANGWSCGAVSSLYTETDPQVGSNTTNYLSKWDGSALVTSGVYESSGNVGIGTASPANKLDVRGGAISSDSNLYLIDQNSGNGIGQQFGFYNWDGSAIIANFTSGNVWQNNRWSLDASGNEAIAGSLTSSGSGNNSFGGNVGIGTTSPQRPLHVASTSATLIVEQTSAGSDLKKRYLNSAGGAMAFGKFTDDMSGSSEHMRISDTGNVGIKTTTPANALDVNGDMNVGSLINSGNGVSTADTRIELGALRTGSGNSYIDFHSVSGTDYDFRILRDSGANGNAHITNTGTGYLLLNESGGNVGIGTSSPASMLQVNGTTTISGAWNNNTTNGLHLGFTTNIGQIYSLHNGVAWRRLDIDGSPVVFNASSGGNVGIGTTSPGEKLEVNGNVKATSFISTSDRRLKTNIQVAPGLSEVLKLQGVQYDWKSNGVHEFGVIAQEVEKIFPDLVVTNQTTGFKAVKYMGLIAPLIEATKEINYRCEMGQKQSQALAALVQKNSEEIVIIKRKLATVESENNQLKNILLQMDARIKKLEQKDQ